ncbi:Ribosomal protein S5 [Elusimicrobium minutum Pei191]|uniref:Small ribosomal subunit protein uS5 n=1 Tax=Elusimicrobium minutum (strain Pei191) TaxID=445932 RepID=B2KEK4_ELUMP|nr:Ribosomal protein S5 [Elusimicrobium minutum Pei191]
MVTDTNKKENKKEAKGRRAEFPVRRPEDGTMTVVNVARTAKVVKGGKRFGFRALVVVGNGNGKVGAAIGKANQVQLAINKAEGHARKHMITFPVVNETIPHETIGKFGASSVWMQPAAPGSGVIAGAGARLVLEAAGIKNIISKSLGSTNACNLVYATLEALKTLKSKEEVLALKGKTTPAAEIKSEAAEAK